MKYFYLIISIFLCITHSSHAMELIKKKKTSKPLQTVNVNFCALGIMDQATPSLYEYNHHYKFTGKDCLNTQTLMKGVDWDDIQLIQNGIKAKGDVNYMYPENYFKKHHIKITLDAHYICSKSKLNLIQIACKEKKYETIKALLAAPDLNINAHEKGTYPAIHLAIKRRDKNIIQLLFDFVGKGYCNFVHDAYIAAYDLCMWEPKCQNFDSFILKKSHLAQFIRTEKMLHRFLRFEASHRQYALLTHILKEKYVEDCDEIPKELQQYITTLYYALNIETVIANKYKHKRKYYDHSMTTKLKRREQLLTNPEPKLLWDV